MKRGLPEHSAEINVRDLVPQLRAAASASEVPAGLVPLVVLVPEGVAGVLGEYGAEHAMSASELAAQTILEKWAPHLVEFGMGAPQ